MDQGTFRPTVGVKAIIVHEGRLVAVKKLDADGVIYSFPGGRSEGGETLDQALRRELWEEAGQDIEVGELLFVREYIGRNHEFAATDAHVHVVDHMFRCTLPDPSAPLSPRNPDPDQVGIEWLPIDELGDYPFFPRALIPYLVEMSREGESSAPLYVGDVN